jgi:ABC-type multidrug transport system ATPase subunit
MYEGIIETLIKLFAIVTEYSDKDSLENSKKSVISYLNENFSKELNEKYLQLYIDELEYFHVNNREILYKGENEDKKQINHLYIDKICNNIVELFNIELRFLIVVQLLNFIKKPNGTGEQERLIVNVVAHGLKINRDEYNNLADFYLKAIDKVKDKSCLFVVNGNEKYHDTEIKHLYRENQQVELELIRITSINTLFFKYKGPRNMYLNGHRLGQNRLYVFPPGGILKTSRIIPIYYSSIMSRFIRQQGKPIIVYNAENIEYRFSRKVYGLHPFSFQERSGDLVGILGGSGVGKTTLLNVLNGKLKPNNGKITINGLDLHAPENKDKFNGIIGYVPQDDLLIEELSVYKNLEFNARFCFGNLNNYEIETIIEQTLSDFDLIEARDLIVGSPLKKILSGGQRKRLNIALELMREPSILFVDEPTSGLSSADSEKVMFLLKKQCLKGKLVIVNIHQPASDIYKLFDRMIVMDKGGRVVFFGNPMEAVTHFKNEADYINPNESECLACGNVKTEQPLRIIEERMVDPFGRSIRKRKISPEDWFQRYKEKVEPRVIDFMKLNPPNNEEFPEVKFKTPKWKQQLKLFLKRDIETKKSNRQYLSIAFFEAPILALILGFFSKYAPTGKYIFANNDNIPSFLFMSVVVALFIGLSISAEEIFKDRRVRKREEFLNLSKGAYFSSKILLLFSLSAIQVISFVLIGHYMLEFRGLTFSHWALLFTTACFANLLGLNLSSGLNSAVAIYILIPLLLVPQLLLSGIIVDFNKMHPSMSSFTKTPLIGDVMTSRWAYEALAVNDFVYNPYRKNTFNEEKEKNHLAFRAFEWIHEAEKKLVLYSDTLSTDKHIENENQSNILKNTILVLQEETSLNFDTLQMVFDAINTKTFSVMHKEILANYLEIAKNQFVSKHNAASRRLDYKIEKMIAGFDGDRGKLVDFRDMHVNKSLENMVRSRYSPESIKIINGQIIQADEPIFRKPVHNNGRTHFYASHKYIGNLKISTVVFNILVIWAFTILLMVTLYFDILRKTLAYIEHWRLLQLAILRDKIFYNPMAFTKKKK